MNIQKNNKKENQRTREQTQYTGSGTPNGQKISAKSGEENQLKDIGVDIDENWKKLIEILAGTAIEILG